MSKLVGYSRVSFNGANDQFIQGYSLYFVNPISSDNGAGFKFDVFRGSQSSCFVFDEVFKSLKLEVGKEYSYSFTRSGKIDPRTIVKIA